MSIPGLRYIPQYLKPVQHDALLATIDAEPWRDFAQRRGQIYGYSYHYAKGGIFRVGDLPSWGHDVAVQLTADALMPEVADQLIVNEYQPGFGIPSHVDAPVFTDTIVAISLGSSCIMEFAHPAGHLEEQLLEPMSALVIGGEARTDWKHSIPARAIDVWQGREWPRSRRVSLTFRKMLPEDLRRQHEPHLWGPRR